MITTFSRQKRFNDFLGLVLHVNEALLLQVIKLIHAVVFYVGWRV